MNGFARLSIAFALIALATASAGAVPASHMERGFAGHDALVRIQAMPKPGGGRCVAYAQQTCGIGGSKDEAICRKQARMKCLRRGN